MYKIERIENTDEYILTYKDKEIKFKNTIDITRKIQLANAKGRTKMIIELTKQGITKKDLIIERIENGKKYYDNTNYTELEEVYIQEASAEIMMDVIEKLLGMSLIELFIDMGIENDEATAQKFTEDFMSALINNKKEISPSK